MTLTVIVVLGSLGCLARWAIEEVVERRVLSHRPYATMAVNALGAVITGLAVYASLHSGASGALHDATTIKSVNNYVVTGFCGGFTTFSSAIAIPYVDWQRGARGRAIALIGFTPALCIAGYWVGELLARLFTN